MISLDELSVNTKEIKFSKDYIKRSRLELEKILKHLDDHQEESRKACIRVGCLHDVKYKNKRLFRKESAYISR